MASAEIRKQPCTHSPWQKIFLFVMIPNLAFREIVRKLVLEAGKLTSLLAFPPCVRVPIYFRFCKLHPISYPPSPFHSPCFISSSDPVPLPPCLCFQLTNLATNRICIILDFGRFFSTIIVDRWGAIFWRRSFHATVASGMKGFFANFNRAGPGLSSVTMKFTANTITGLDWAAKVHSHGSYVHFETTAL